MMRRNKSLFWMIYRIVLVVFAVILIAASVYVIRLLKDYEASQPKYAAEAVYEKYFKNFDASAYIDICKSSSVFENKDALVSYLNDTVKGQEIKYMKVSSSDKDVIKYIVKAGDTKFASFTLSADTEKSEKFTQYTASDFELFTSSKTKITVEAPENYKIFINGTELGEEYIKERDIKSESCDHMPEGVRGIYYTKYAVSGLISEPEVTAKTADGTAAEVVANNGTYRVQVQNDAVLQEQQKDRILEACKKYAVYMQYDSTVAVMGFGQIKGYFDPSSELYEDIRTVENMFVIEYSSYEFADEKTSEFVRFDDNTFSCRVSFTHILHRRGAEDYKDYLDLTLYLRNVNGEYLIYDMSQN